MPNIKKLLTAAAGTAASGDKLYPEDLFSTFEYTQPTYTSDPAATVTVNNGLDLTGEGGLVWVKNTDSGQHVLVDSERGNNKALTSNSNGPEFDLSPSYGQTFTLASNGFSIAGNAWTPTNYQGRYVSWSWRKATGWFDVVTYTGDGTSGRNISHNLGSRPAFVMIKRTDASSSWAVWVKIDNTQALTALNLNTNSATGVSVSTYWMDGMTSSVISLTKVADNGSGNTHNVNGGTYVAYLFGDEAIFGEDGDEQICKVGTYTGNGSSSGPTINCGFEPQWIMIKEYTDTGRWMMYDEMREVTSGNYSTSYDSVIKADQSDAEISNSQSNIEFTSSGFKIQSADGNHNSNGDSYLYMAIRRPMKVPEAGTDVFKTYHWTGNNESSRIHTINFRADMMWMAQRNAANGDPIILDRKRGFGVRLRSWDNTSEFHESDKIKNVTATTFNSGSTHSSYNAVNGLYKTWMFQRAPKFFDIVCYDGVGASGTINHSLGVTPELIIVKNRNYNTTNWKVWRQGATTSTFESLNSEYGSGSPGYSLNTLGATQFGFSTSDSEVTDSSYDYVAYLFASLAGVSKIGTYSGTGNDVNVDCGFSNGARFILIKIIGSGTTGDWYMYDTEAGITTGNDPYMQANEQESEAGGTDYIDPLSSGFTVTSSAPAALNASGSTYLFLAIA